MGGILRIAADGMSGDLIDGHAWIEHVDAAGTVTTYGTWGNDPLGTGNGLFENLELGRAATAMREVALTDDQEVRMLAAIEDYRARGDEAWSLLNPCSSFAANLWEEVTGEAIAHRSWGVISNPNRLVEGIEALNAARPLGPAADTRAVGPSIRVGSPVMECRSSRGPP